MTHAPAGPRAAVGSRPLPTASSAHRRRDVTLRCIAALAAGAGLWMTFPPFEWWFLAPLAVAGLALAVRGASLRLAFTVGWLFGLGLFLPMLTFLLPLGVDAWLVLAVGEAVFLGALGAALALVQRHTAWPALVGPLWVAEEFVRDRVPFGGFPWGRLAFGQSAGPVLPVAAVGGAVGVTLATAALGGLLAWVVRPGRHVRAAAAGLVGGLLVVLGGAALVPVPTTGTSAGGPSGAVVGLVQGNVPRLGLREFEQRRAVTADHLAETRALAAAVAAGTVPRPQVVIWPENASDDDPLAGDPGNDATARSMVERAVAAAGVPVIVGAVLNGPGPHVRNAAVVWSPTTGPGQIYVKRHLVPFGEYLPLRSVLHGLIGQLSLVGDFVPGRAVGVLRAGGVTLADAICFEIADDAVVRQGVEGGGRVVVVQTNNATYEHAGDDGRGGETAQQLAISRLRAVEHGRAVLVVATSGVSAVIAPDGRVLQRTGVFTPAYLVAQVPLRDPRTVADRLGPWPEWLVAAGAALVLGWMAWVEVATRRRGARAGRG